MQFKPALFVTSALAILAAASPAPLEARGQCGGNGSPYCCNRYGVAQNYNGDVLWGLIQIVVKDLTDVIALDCVSIIGGGSCNQQSVCCTGNSYYGTLIVVDCVGVDL